MYSFWSAKKKLARKGSMYVCMHSIMAILPAKKNHNCSQTHRTATMTMAWINNRLSRCHLRHSSCTQWILVGDFHFTSKWIWFLVWPSTTIKSHQVSWNQHDFARTCTHKYTLSLYTKQFLFLSLYLTNTIRSFLAFFRVKCKWLQSVEGIRKRLGNLGNDITMA